MAARRAAGAASVSTGQRRAKLGRVHGRESVQARGTVAELAVIDELTLVAAYVSITITSKLTAAAQHQFRTQPDPTGDPEYFVYSDVSPATSNSVLSMANVPEAQDLVLCLRVWIDGSYDTGWHDTGIRFSTPGKDEEPIEEFYSRGVS